jgi:hypothetical protein
LLRSVGVAQSFKAEYADGWFAKFEETVQKYHLPGPEVRPLRLSLLNSIFTLVEGEDEMVDADLRYLADLGLRYDIKNNITPELLDTVFRMDMKGKIQCWRHGDIPHTECAGLVLQKGEVCHCEEPAGLRIQRTQRQYVGGYSSVSVPVPLVRGVRFRVGGFKGHPIDHTVLEDGGTGVLHITNQRVCFTGQQRSVAIPYKKMISVGGFDDGFIVQTSNEKRPGIFVVRHPELTTQILALASQPAEVENPTKR